MFNKNTLFKVRDNSGAKLVKCIHSYNNFLNVSSVILVTVVKAKPNRKVKKSDLYPALILLRKNTYFRNIGVYIKPTKNYVVLLKKQDRVLLASRIRSFCLLEVRLAGFSRIASMCINVF